MRPDMDEVDRALLADETLVPSSGFAASVMEAVREAAAAPPPLAFPWLRFGIGLGACVAWAAAGVAILSRVDLSVASSPALVYSDEGRRLLAAVMVMTLISLAGWMLHRRRASQPYLP